MFRRIFAAYTSASALRRSASARAATLYCGIANGVRGAFGVSSGLVAIHALTAGLIATPRAVYRGGGCVRNRGRYGCGVKPNRSIPAATVVPVLIYPDVRAAVRWLTEAFGFEERLRIGEEHRSQLKAGDGGAVIVADVRREQR